MELKIVVYSKSACPQCESAKMLLKSKSLDFEEIKIDGEDFFVIREEDIIAIVE